VIPFRFNFLKFATALLSSRRKQQQQLDNIQTQLIHMSDALADLQTAATAANTKLESIADNVVALRAQVTALQQSSVDPAAVETIVGQMNTTLADVEAKLNPATPAKS
jgi:chromosome segregation ATPase